MRKVTAKWTMKDGSKIRICDMTDSHLLNTIRMLERMHESQLMCGPPCFQGEMAQLYADQEWSAIESGGPAYTFPIYERLIEDAERRGLIVSA